MSPPSLTNALPTNVPRWPCARLCKLVLMRLTATSRACGPSAVSVTETTISVTAYAIVTRNAATPDNIWVARAVTRSALSRIAMLDTKVRRLARRADGVSVRVARPAAVAGQQVGDRFAAHQRMGLAAGDADQWRAAHQVAARSDRV